MSLPHVTLWAAQDSPRLRYVLNWLFGQRFGLSYSLTHDKARAASEQFCMAYGWVEHVASIHAGSLLWEESIKPQAIPCVEWQGLHTLFFDEGSPCDIQFDMLSGIFYLLARYEEYLPFTPDRHNRYPAQQSILHPVLERPVVDEWVEALRLFLEQVWNVSIPQKPFSFQPTYDIDIAWSYRFKGFRRSIGAALKDAAGMNWKRLGQRLRVLRQQEVDPFDSFIWILTQHMDGEPRPLYFILAALQASPFDKNIAPLHFRMSAMIEALSSSGTIGVHPSYYSDVKPERLHEEKATLERIVAKPVSISRQHYIKLRFPQTYRALIAVGIGDDWSMGFSTMLGFRAGTGSSFPWYDLADEKPTALRVHSFAFMDSTAHYDLGLLPEEAFNRLRQMAAKLQACGGELVTIMHNFSLGADAEWKGWRREYERFLTDMKTTGNTARS